MSVWWQECVWVCVIVRMCVYVFVFVCVCVCVCVWERKAVLSRNKWTYAAAMNINFEIRKKNNITTNNE